MNPITLSNVETSVYQEQFQTLIDMVDELDPSQLDEIKVMADETVHVFRNIINERKKRLEHYNVGILNK